LKVETIISYEIKDLKMKIGIVYEQMQ